MPIIETKTGDATSPRPGGEVVVIGHICNNVGAWGAGFVLAVNKLSPIPKSDYMYWKKANLLQLGRTQFTQPLPGLFVANMIAQDGISSTEANPVLVDYKALERCLKLTLMFAARLGGKVYFPAGMGSVLAGGNKDRILKMIEKVAIDVEVSEFGRENDVNLTITLWEFEDKTADSYVADRSKNKDPVADLGT